MTTELQLQKHLEKAMFGRALWLSLTKRLELQSQDYVLIFPSNHVKVNYYGLLYIDQFVESKKPMRTFILTDNQLVGQAYSHVTDKIAECELVSSEEMTAILNFYTLYLFSDRVIVVDIDQLSARSIGNIIGTRNITIEEIISVGIYQIRKFHPEEDIIYSGSNEQLKYFFCHNKKYSDIGTE